MKLECLDDILIVCLFHLVIKIEFLYQKRTKHIPEMNFQVLSLNLCFVFFSGFSDNKWRKARFSPFCSLVEENASSWTGKTYHTTENTEAQIRDRLDCRHPWVNVHRLLKTVTAKKTPQRTSREMLRLHAAIFHPHIMITTFEQKLEAPECDEY